MEQFEFECKKLMDCMKEIDDKSKSIIKEIIGRYSPIQIGEDVIATRIDGDIKVRVSKITLCAQGSYRGWPSDPLSFSYEGRLLTKDGEVMKKRKPIVFNSFVTWDKRKCLMPSYLRVAIRPARMHYGDQLYV